MKIYKDTLSVIILVILASFIRFLYYFHAPAVIMAGDSYGYYQLGTEMIKKVFFIHYVRPPIYPLFLNLPLYLSGKLEAEIFSGPFLQAARQIFFIQSILGILGIISIYFILRLAGIRRLYSFLFTLFIASNLSLFFWERMLMTEALAIPWLTSTVWILVKMLKQPKLSYFPLLFFLFAFGFLLRPFYTFFPPVILIFIAFYQRKRKVILGCLAVFLVFISLVWFYRQQNILLFHYNGISRISDVNILGLVLKYNLPIEAGKKYHATYEKVSTYRHSNGKKEGLAFIDQYPQIYMTKDNTSWNELGRFNIEVIRANLLIYSAKSLLQLPYVLLDKSPDILLVNPPQKLLDRFFHLLFWLDSKLQFLTLIVFLGFFPTVIQFLKKPNFSSSFWLLIGIISLYHSIVAGFLSYVDFARLIAPAEAWLYLFSFYCWVKLGYFLKERISMRLYLQKELKNRSRCKK